MAYTVYVLISESSRRRYVGQTTDLDRRLAEHNNPDHNPAMYTTKHAGPWRLIYAETHDTRGQAMRRERWLKSGAGREWLKSVLERERGCGGSGRSGAPLCTLLPQTRRESVRYRLRQP